jgi:hypothetical protein
MKKCILDDSTWYSITMFLYFKNIVYILGVISAFVRYKKLYHAMFLGKNTPKYNILGEFQGDFPPYYIVWLWMLFW